MSNVKSVRFLSVAGTTNIKWNLVVELWSKLPHLIGLDVSRTDISPNTVARFFSSSFSLKVLCALNCPALEEDATFVSNNNHKGKVLLAVFTDILKGVANLFVDTPTTERNIFSRRNSKKDKKLDDILNWLESMICTSLLRVSGSNPPGLDNFWLNQGASLLLSFMQSAQEEVQERAATALATFVVIDDENANIDTGRAEAVMRDNGIRLLLNLAQSWREGLQSEAAKAIANLSVNAKVPKLWRRKEASAFLQILPGRLTDWLLKRLQEDCGTSLLVAIAEAGGLKALVDLIFKWSTSTGGEGVLAARALANLAAHGDSNSNNAAVGQEAGALDALVQLTRSPHDGVKHNTIIGCCIGKKLGALWNLSFDDRNREAIAAAGGVEALVALAHSCSNASHGLQERAAGALWGLSVSEANSIAIGREGGVAPLITLAQSDAEDVHETAAGALWNLAFNPGNALRIVDEGGVPALVHLCSSSVSKMTRFMSALALAYMFDGRMDEIALVGTSTEGSSKSINLDGPRRMALKNIEAFVLTFADPQAFSAAAASSAPAALSQVTESARIQEAVVLRLEDLLLCYESFSNLEVLCSIRSASVYHPWRPACSTSREPSPDRRSPTAAACGSRSRRRPSRSKNLCKNSPPKPGAASD
ncbi:UNVERIFIED_CONTAM: protein ARABIDILLO 2 [Sesamum calycinum]|uniref:Protein ARABIDILLO 2 n=1 Tax=Sesamum calycinum TaxID=2727403 RepID=A0AAW2JKX4_9LAMI